MSMEIGSKAWARFVSVKLDGYKVFNGNNTIEFNRGMTVIAGPGGSGKTTIFNLLAAMGAEAEMKGNLELIRKYGRFFFIDSENAAPGPGEDPCTCIPCGGHRFSHEVSTGAIFAEMTGAGHKKAWGTDPALLPFGEQRCRWYASAFAALEVLKMDLPVVIDSPYARLDPELRQGVSAFLRRQSCQLVLLGHESEFAGLEKPDHVLENVDGGSRARKRDHVNG
jgi:ATPase subunit of ABC transporter with duplicated ATPase domains